jgi:hypothetical protein
MRDLDLTVGPALQDELAVTLPPLLAGARWYCGQVYPGRTKKPRRPAGAAGGLHLGE